MKKEKIARAIVLTYAIVHIIYAFWLMTDTFAFGWIWIGFGILELGVVWISQKRKNTGKIIVSIVSIVLVLQTILSGVLYLYPSDKIEGSEDYLVILGMTLKHDTMSDSLVMRLDKGLEYLENNPDCSIIVCGGIMPGNTVSEASLMKKYLVENGIDASRIRQEDTSTDTISNMNNMKEYVKEDSSIVVISSDYHCLRIRAICQKNHLRVKCLKAKSPLVVLPSQLFFEKLGYIKLWLLS